MQVEGEVYISCCLGMASSQDSVAVPHLELGQLSLHCSCWLMQSWETTIDNSQVRGSKPKHSLGTSLLN